MGQEDPPDTRARLQSVGSERDPLAEDGLRFALGSLGSLPSKNQLGTSRCGRQKKGKVP